MAGFDTMDKLKREIERLEGRRLEIGRREGGRPESGLTPETVASFLDLIALGPAVLLRSTFPGHLTASAWVVARDSGAALLIHHRKLGFWVQPGGHADGEADLDAVARREVLEETGVDLAENLTHGAYGRVFDLDIHPIPAFGSEPAHLHYDVRFLYVLPTIVPISGNHEVTDVRWAEPTVLPGLTSEESVLRMARTADRLTRADRYGG